MESTTLSNDSPEKPSQVKNAVYLLYATLVMGVVSSILNLSDPGVQASLGFALVAMVITFAILLFNVTMISRGRNWARMVYLVLYVIGLPRSIVFLLQMLPSNTLTALIGTVQAILQLVAIVLLFQKPSSVWFKGESNLEPMD